MYLQLSCRASKTTKHFNFPNNIIEASTVLPWRQAFGTPVEPNQPTLPFKRQSCWFLIEASLADLTRAAEGLTGPELPREPCPFERLATKLGLPPNCDIDLRRQEEMEVNVQPARWKLLLLCLQSSKTSENKMTPKYENKRANRI